MCAAYPPLPKIAAVRDQWQPATARTYGAAIYRAGDCYVKLAPRVWGPDDLRSAPAREAAQLAWLGAHGLPVPEVVDVDHDTEWNWLVTRVCPGVPVMQAPDVDVAVDAFADLARALHRLPPLGCPDPVGIDSLLDWARRATANHWVDTADLDPRNAGRSPAELLAELEKLQRPSEIAAVTHGDLTPDNVLVDADASTVTAVLDAGRLGVTDVWRDLALARRNLGEYDAHLADRFLAKYGVTADPAREAFYRLLDEFL